MIVELEEEFAFSKTFDIDSSSCTIIQHGDRFELRIDNQVFSHLLDVEKNKIYFGKNPEKTSITITSSFIGNDNKKVGFGINSQPLTQTKTQVNEAPLFNFSIKPAGNNFANNSMSKKFSEVNSCNDFTKKKQDNFKFSEDTSSVSTTPVLTKQDNVNLINFDDNISNNSNTNNKIGNPNIIDLFGNSNTFNNNNNVTSHGNTIDLIQNFNNQSNDNFNNQINFHMKNNVQNNYK